MRYGNTYNCGAESNPYHLTLCYMEGEKGYESAAGRDKPAGR